MSEFVFKLPDLGEGTVEAEIVEWHVVVGDVVREGDIIADVMTDKANIEVPAPVSGTVLRTTGEPGDVVAVGAELIAISEEGTASTQTAQIAPPQSAATDLAPSKPDQADSTGPAQPVPDAPACTSEDADPEPDHADVAVLAQPSARPVARPAAVRSTGEVRTSPAVRRRAKEAGVDLTMVTGSGPKGRILASDLQVYLSSAQNEPAASQGSRIIGQTVTWQDRKVIGIRRVIAQRLAQSKREIPHFAYVEEIDVTDLERLRAHLNQTYDQSLSILPFVAVALLKAVDQFPQTNSHFDADSGMLRTFHGVHLGIAAQTPDGLKVPVVDNAHLLDLWDLAAAIAACAERAKTGVATPAELSGSTITLTSLGRLGGIASTPIINRPEVAIVGVNRTVERPAVVDGQITVRTMMNLSSSFDHRFVDGFDAASFIQAMRLNLEHPATLFLNPP
jgi:2-oxoisovalerate dehydrogenase E2 component (dihydrolipoyl transacylase)